MITKHGSYGDAILAASNVFGNLGGGNDDVYKFWSDDTVIPIIEYGPATIFSNKVPALDINFINPNVGYTPKMVDFDYEIDDEGNFRITSEVTETQEITEEEKLESNTAKKLRDTIAKWYVTLRNIAIVGLLSVLVYVAIRIIMSSTAGETAKYKTMLKDWLIALCILVFMHYIMAFLLNLTGLVTDLLTSGEVVGYERRRFYE